MVKPVNPRETAKFIAKRAKNVKVTDKGVKKVAADLYSSLFRGAYTLSLWREHNLNPGISNEFAINWIFLVNSINFSYWPDPDQEFAVTYKQVEYTGYWAICAIINRALNQGIPMVSPEYYSNLSYDQVQRIFRAHKKGKPNEPMELPLLKERANIMKDNGKILVKKFSSNFVTVVVKAKKSARSLLQLIYENFPSFRDECVFNKERVGFYRRAQLLISDIYACHEGKNLGKFDDIDYLTLLVDQRAPQYLHFCNVLSYSLELRKKLKQGEVLKYDDPDVIEMRGVAIHAYELIKREVKRMQVRCGVKLPLPLTPAIMEFYFWDLERNRRDEIDRQLPSHKIRAIHY